MNSMAIFDVDGTLLRPPSMERRFLRFLWQCGELSTRELVWHFSAAGLFCLTGKVPQAAPRFYLSGMKTMKVVRLAEDFVEQEITRALYCEGLKLIDQQRQAGRKIWLLSGAPSFLLMPLAERLNADLVTGLELESRDGIFRERIHGIHPRGRGKLMLIRRAATETNGRLPCAFAFGDSIHDRYLLEAAEHPIAVNPDRRLKALALRRGWRIEDFRGKAA